MIYGFVLWSIQQHSMWIWFCICCGNYMKYLLKYADVECMYVWELCESEYAYYVRNLESILLAGYYANCINFLLLCIIINLNSFGWGIDWKMNNHGMNFTIFEAFKLKIRKIFPFFGNFLERERERPYKNPRNFRKFRSRSGACLAIPLIHIHIKVMSMTSAAHCKT